MKESTAIEIMRTVLEEIEWGDSFQSREVLGSLSKSGPVAAEYWEAHRHIIAAASMEQERRTAELLLLDAKVLARFTDPEHRWEKCQFQWAARWARWPNPSFATLLHQKVGWLRLTFPLRNIPDDRKLVAAELTELGLTMSSSGQTWDTLSFEVAKLEPPKQGMRS